MTILKPNLIVDVYEEEAPVDFAGLKSNTLAAILRASVQWAYGRRQDYKVEQFVAQCKAVGMKYGLYHFLWPNHIAEQAALFISVWNKVGGADLPPFVDIEVDKRDLDAVSVGQSSWQYQIKTFLDLVEAGTGKKPIIYTNKNYWGFTYTRNLLLQLVPPSWSKDYLLWVAQYPDFPDQVSAPMSMPGGFTDWVIWQYEQHGRQKGYKANDLNTAKDSFVQQYLGGVVPPPVPGPVQKVDVKIMSNDPKSELTDVMVDGVSVKDKSTLTIFPFPVAEPAPQPVPDGRRYGILRHRPRDVIAGRYAPDTVTLQAVPKGTGKGPSLPITDNMWKFIRLINNDAGYKYARSVGMMWINGEYADKPYAQAERISCGGNFVEILKTENGHAQLKSFNYTDRMAYDPIEYNWHYHPELFFKAVAINKDGNLINVASDVDCFLPLLNRNDEVWVPIAPVYDDKGALDHAGLEMFPELPITVSVITTLDIFDAMEGNEVASAFPAETLTIYNYALRGCSVWGQSDKGWIRLLIADKTRIFPTSWRLETAGVIPPD